VSAHRHHQDAAADPGAAVAIAKTQIHRKPRRVERLDDRQRGVRHRPRRA
jgi:hypothetical protein